MVTARLLILIKYNYKSGKIRNKDLDLWMSVVSPSSFCFCPLPAGFWYTVLHTERSSDCCGLYCSPAQPIEPETGCSCRLYVILPAWKASAHRNNMAPGERNKWSELGRSFFYVIWSACCHLTVMEKKEKNDGRPVETR